MCHCISQPAYYMRKLHNNNICGVWSPVDCRLYSFACILYMMDQLQCLQTFSFISFFVEKNARSFRTQNENINDRMSNWVQYTYSIFMHDERWLSFCHTILSSRCVPKVHWTPSLYVPPNYAIMWTTISNFCFDDIHLCYAFSCLFLLLIL